MWKVISGIAVVVLLDVAFIWTIALEPGAPEIARNIGPTAALPVVHDQQMSAPAAIADSTEPVTEDSFGMPVVRESRTRTRAYYSARRSARPDTPSAAAAAPVKLFQDTIIWIGKTEVPVKIDQREELPVVAESRYDNTMQASISEPHPVHKKKRSFESKAFSVIKKPYDWIKAVADKLH